MLKNAPADKDSEGEEDAQEGGAGEEKVEEVPVELVIKILEVEGSGKHCVEFTRKRGDQLEFFEEFAKIRDEIADITTTV